MRKKKNGRQLNKEGFTLAELLVTAAIVAILAAVAFAAVFHYMKALKQTELDSTAREIFAAAQNHAAVSKSGGKWSQYVRRHLSDAAEEKENTLGLPMEEPSDWGTEKDGVSPEGVYGKWKDPGDFYYIVISSENAEEGIRKYLLPKGSIDGSLRGDRNIVVEYDAKSAAVYGVWYSKPGDEALQSGSSIRIPQDKSMDLRTKDNRKKLSYGSMIGYYGGAAALTVSPEKDGRVPLAVTISNNDRLTLNILDESEGNSIYGSGSSDIDVTVKGDTSGAEKKIPIGDFDRSNTVKGEGEGTLYTYNLDSVTDGKEGHFAYRFRSSDNGKSFIPGENLTITVKTSVEDSSGLNSEYTTETGANSLFADLDADELQNGSLDAQISYGRHLENLSRAVSGVRSTGKFSITGAEVQKDISWKTAYFGIDDRSAVDRYSGNGGEGLSVNVYKDGDGKTAAAGKYYSVTNDDLSSFEGNGFLLSDLDIVKEDENSNAGLIGTVKGNTGFSMSNVMLRDAKVYETSPSGSTGILLGRFNGQNAALKITGCALKGSISVTSAENAGMNAGGLAGRIDAGHLSLSDISASADRIRVSADRPNEKETEGSDKGTKKDGGYGNAGGLFGYIRLPDSSLTVDDSIEMDAEDLQVKGCNTAGGLIGKISYPNRRPSNLEIDGTVIRFRKMELSAGEGNAGGMTGYARVKDLDVKNAVICPEKRSLHSDSLTVTGSDGHAGGLFGAIDASSKITIKESEADAGYAGTIRGGLSAGGLSGRSESSGETEMTDCSASAYVSASGNYLDYSDFSNVRKIGAGGFAGILDAGAGSHVKRCYCGGRTEKGKYADSKDTGRQGHFNVTGYDGARGNASAGGFAGDTSDYKGKIEDSYTTSSAAAENGAAGGFIGRNSDNGSMRVENCYTTALTKGSKAGAFLGSGSHSSVFSKCYYLSGVSGNVDKPLASGSDIAGVSAVTRGEYPFDGNGGTAEAYDESLGSSYPYRTASGLSAGADRKNTEGRHIGDWPDVEEEDTSRTGFLYYEEIGGEIYYHGYAAKNEGGTLYDTKYTEMSKALPKGHGKYVSESGYLLLVKKGTPSNEIQVGFYDKASGLKANADDWIHAQQGTGSLTKYSGPAIDKVTNRYDAYYISEKDYSGSSYLSYPTGGGTVLYICSRYEDGRYHKTAAMTFFPFYADTVIPAKNGNLEDVSKRRSEGKDYDYVIRSADQLKQLAQNSSFNWGKAVIEQQLDISFDPEKVTFRSHGKKEPESAYDSPTIRTFGGSGNEMTYQADHPGTSDRTDYYALDSLKHSFVSTVQDSSIRDLRVTNMDADCFVKQLCYGSGKIEDITVENSKIDTAGLVESNLQGKISGCSIINANIGRWGLAKTNTGTISGCQIYSSDELYKSYEKAEGTKYFVPNRSLADKDGVGGDSDPELGYGLTVVGISRDEDDTCYDSAAGFVEKNDWNAKIENCSFTGKVYAEKNACGFADTTYGNVENCYANVMVSGTGQDSTASGFVRSLSGGSVTGCHSAGTLAGTNGAGFVYETGGSPAVSRSYSAVWESRASSSKPFCFVKNGGNISDNAFLSGVRGMDEGTMEGVSAKTAGELADLCGTAYGEKCTKENTAAYGQYTSGERYPYPMPKGMKAFGDWK